MNTGNPMHQYQAFPGPPPMTAQGVATGQPRVGYARAAQWGKYFAYLHRFEPLASGAVRVSRSFSVDGSYDFLVQKLALLSANVPDTGGGILLQTQVSPMGELFESDPIYASNWGSGQFPELIGKGVPETLSRNAVFTMFATDGQAVPADTTVIMAYHGTKVARNQDAQGNLVPMVWDRFYPQARPYKYAATFNATTTDNAGHATGPIPAAQSRIFNIVVDNAGDFDVNAITVVSDTLVTVDIQSDSDNWFLSPLRAELLGGSFLEAMPVQGEFSGEHPFHLPGPRLITAAGYITVQVANLDAINATRCQVVFQGQRLYPGGGAPLYNQIRQQYPRWTVGQVQAAYAAQGGVQ